ncbi:MAG: type I pullulanase [Oscillospiraceae bacterium]|nr:type I pullulanase [Candidatus Ruminococcus equi]
MNLSKKVIAVLLTLVMVISMMSVAVISSSAADNPYSVAAMALDDEYAYDGTLGAIYSKDSTTFKLWAPTAKSVKVNLFATGSDDEEGAKDLGTYDMSKEIKDEKFTGAWEVTVKGDLEGVYYTYSTNVPRTILAEDYVDREAQDVYSYAVGVNGDRSMVVDLSKTDPKDFDKDTHIYVDKQTDAIVWEVQVKDFSYDENSGVSDKNRGKFLAFTETGTTLNGEGELSTCIDYLKGLGITHVQINPFYDFATIDEAKDDGTEFNWGYDPKNYGVPEGSYSTNPYDGKVRINECKQMIQALHEAGIGVIMDVVYNHTYSVDSCFNYAVPNYYYRMTAMGTYSQQSGCGNDTASERYMYRRYMRDMLKYWVDEYHVDGFRFDLMGVHDVETMNLIREDMDKIDPRIIMYGEGWAGSTVIDPETCSGTPTMTCTQPNAAYVSDRIGFFNDQIRDGIKAGVFDGATAAGFVSGTITSAPYVSYGIRAQTFGKASTWHAKQPTQCVTYASCHDNMTLYDKLVAINHGTGADYRLRYNDAIAQNKLSGAIINTAQGIDFMLAGEEMGRSKDGDENSYKSAATENMIDWSLLETNADLVSYYKGLIELRKSFTPFNANIRDVSTDENPQDDSYAYHFATSVSSANQMIAFTIDNDNEGEWNKVAVVFNGQKTAKTFKFSTSVDPTISEDTEWVVIANDKQAGITKLSEFKGLTFSVPASSAVIAVEKSTFEEANLPSRFSKVIVNNIDEETKNVISSNVILGDTGTGYKVSYDTSVPLKYEYDYCEGKEAGTFTKEDTTVNYYFKKFVPTSFTAPYGDVDNDGSVNIVDATMVQKWLAKLITLDEEHIKRGDYDYNEKTEIVDCTLLQRYLAKYDVSVYTITSNYIGVDDEGKEKKLASPSVREGRLGTEYKTEGVKVAYYVLKETPQNATGIVTGNIVVNYYYKYEVSSPVIHVKHSGELTWAPTLWAWAYDDAGTAINCYESWPGLDVTKVDEDGWFTTTFPIPGGLDYYIILSKGGSPQTMDYGPISYDTYPEIWVVIDDTKCNVNKGDWLTYYNYNPDKAN